MLVESILAGWVLDGEVAVGADVEPGASVVMGPGVGVATITGASPWSTVPVTWTSREYVAILWSSGRSVWLMSNAPTLKLIVCEAERVLGVNVSVYPTAAILP